MSALRISNYTMNRDLFDKSLQSKDKIISLINYKLSIDNESILPKEIQLYNFFLFLFLSLRILFVVVTVYQHRLYTIGYMYIIIRGIIDHYIFISAQQGGKKVSRDI